MWQAIRSPVSLLCALLCCVNRHAPYLDGVAGREVNKLNYNLASTTLKEAHAQGGLVPSAQRRKARCHLDEAICCTWVRPKHGKLLAVHLSCHAAFTQLCKCRPFRAVQPCNAATCLPSSISSSAQLLMLLSGRKNSVRGTDFFLLAIAAGEIKARDQSQDCTRKAAE